MLAPPLLATKLYRPRPRPDGVPRPRLTARLAAGLARPLTLVSAPAGFGKTTLIAAALAAAEADGLAIGWLALDEADNDPARFLAYVIAALSHAGLPLEEWAALQDSPQPPEPKIILAGLINALAARAEPVALVLDDYHVITAPAVHALLGYWLDHQPAALRLVIATRADLPLPLNRLRVRDQLVELRPGDLRFTAAEAAAFFEKRLGLTLTAGDLAALEQRTEGWAAALQLAGLALRAREATGTATRLVEALAGSQRHLFDYLTEEVLNRLPPEVQQFLLQTAVLDRLSAELCAAVLAGAVPDAAALLDQLERDNLFLSALDDRREWFRYHPLFAEVLRARLRHEHPVRLPFLHTRAADWFEAHGSPAAAVQHALAAGDLDRVARLSEQAAPALLAHGQFATLLAWTDPLPPEAFARRPRVGLARAAALIDAQQLDEAERALQIIEAAAANDASLLSEAHALRVSVAIYRGEAAQAIAYAQQALAELPADRLAQRAEVTMRLGLATEWLGDTRQAGEAYQAAAQLARQASDLNTAALATSNYAGVLANQGRLREAAQTDRRALEIATAGAADMPVAGLINQALADYAYEWNQLEEAETHLRAASAVLQRGTHPRGQLMMLTTQAQLHLAREEWEAAAAALDQAERLAADLTMPVRFTRLVTIGRVRLWLARGDVAAAAEWAANSGLTIDQVAPGALFSLHLARAAVAVAQGDWPEANAWLARVRAAAEQQHSAQSLLAMLVKQIAADQASGQPARAEALLTEALTLAEPDGYVRTFIDEGAPMRAALEGWWQRAAAGATPALRAYAARLRSAYGGPADTSAAQPLLEPLTDRELEVLRLLAEGHSNPAIAEKLVIAVGTVKSYTSAIYGKLGVNNRTQAVRQAQELGLLP